MICFNEPSVGRLSSEFDATPSPNFATSDQTEEQLQQWVLSRLRSKPYTTRVQFDLAGRADLTVPVQLLEIDGDSHRLSEQPIDVEVMDLNPSRLVIRHRELIRQREAVVILQLRDGHRVPARVQFTWTRFLGPGTYHSSGRFVVGPLSRDADTRSDFRSND